MLRLHYEEIERLQIILVEHCEAKPSTYLKSLIINSRIGQKILNISHNVSAPEWVEIIMAELSESYSLDGNSQRLDFVLFLEYFQIKLPPKSDERLFVRGIISKLDNLAISESHSRSKDIKYLRNKELQKQSEISIASSPSTSQIIDQSIIVDHDLEDLEDILRRELGFRGLFTFSINGHDTILKEYIIERILRELKNQTNPPRSYKTPININLNKYISINSQIIEQKIRERKICNQLADLVRENTVIIIWNYDIEQKMIEIIAHEFLRTIQAECFHLLQENNQCLVIILANVYCQFDIEEFISLKTPEQFILEGKNGLIEWFKYKLSKFNLQDDYIKQYVQRIEGQNGHLLGTYQEIKYIIDELNGRI
ncbi:MAG: hypothetical protein QNJ51_20125 [Calothrix sp. MO_167.B12]|nr:hypothetical protein [Calothrix sp. MO_167.B12]